MSHREDAPVALKLLPGDDEGLAHLLRVLRDAADAAAAAAAAAARVKDDLLRARQRRADAPEQVRVVVGPEEQLRSSGWKGPAASGSVRCANPGLQLSSATGRAPAAKACGERMGVSAP